MKDIAFGDPKNLQVGVSLTPCLSVSIDVVLKVAVNMCGSSTATWWCQDMQIPLYHHIGDLKVHRQQNKQASHSGPEWDMSSSEISENIVFICLVCPPFLLEPAWIQAASLGMTHIKWLPHLLITLPSPPELKITQWHDDYFSGLKNQSSNFVIAKCFEVGGKLTKGRPITPKGMQKIGWWAKNCQWMLVAGWTLDSELVTQQLSHLWTLATMLKHRHYDNQENQENTQAKHMQQLVEEISTGERCRW